MQKLLIATHNISKFNELKSHLLKIPIELVSLSDLHITEEVKEDGKTYEENSSKKALFYSKLSNLPSLSDDAGFEIDALGGIPGVNSKYWVNKKGDDESILKHLAKVAKELPDTNRRAKFVVVLTLALPNGKSWTVREETKGIVSKKPHHKLAPGYPFRPYFYLPEINKYYHEDELTKDELKQYNHRYKAIKNLESIIKKVFELK